MMTGNFTRENTFSKLFAIFYIYFSVTVTVVLIRQFFTYKELRNEITSHSN